MSQGLYREFEEGARADPSPPRRRSPQQIGCKGKSNERWIVGGKLCWLQNHVGLIIDWDCDTANVYDESAFQHVVDNVAGQTVVFTDTGFAKKDWHPDHLRPCQRGEWNERMMIETTLSMLTLVCHFENRLVAEYRRDDFSELVAVVEESHRKLIDFLAWFIKAPNKATSTLTI